MIEPTELVGRWRLRRRIVDHAANDELRTVEGITTLRPVDDDTIRWDEVGSMRWAWNEVPITRTLFVRRRDDGWFVTFEDGRDFHPWQPGVEVEHPCVADLYTGQVDIESLDRWHVRWRAQGPDKDYEMESWLTRDTGEPTQPKLNV